MIDIVFFVDLERDFAGFADELAKAWLAGVFESFKVLAPRVTSWMKQNHPWTNRTGLAERSLSVLTHTRGNEIVMRLFYAPECDYGRWLEVRWGGRWGVIGPAVDYWAARIEGMA